MKIETVKIIDDNKRGFKTINLSDFDKGSQKVYVDKGNLVEVFEAGELGLSKLGADELKILCNNYKIEYVNKEDAKKALSELQKEL